jgi:alkylation response protein AidB-like acyl-CoA dehydrogenase
LDYAQQRIQFGRPIATFQANAFKLARMALEIESARWLTYRAAWLHDQGKPCTKEAAMAKLLASEVYQHVAVEAMQLHGGAAVYEDSVINRHYRDSYLGKITEGTSEIQELIIARQIGLRDVS